MKSILLLCGLVFMGAQAQAKPKPEDIFNFVFDVIQDQINNNNDGGHNVHHVPGGGGFHPGFPGGGPGFPGPGPGHHPGGPGHHPGPGFPPPPPPPGGPGHHPGPGWPPPPPPPPVENKVILEDNGSSILLGRVFIQDEAVDTVNFPACNLGQNKRVTHLMVRARQNAIDINRIKVTFANGQTITLMQSTILQNGQSTQWIALDQARCIRSIRVNGEAFGPGPQSKRAVVSFVGYKEGF